MLNIGCRQIAFSCDWQMKSFVSDENKPAPARNKGFIEHFDGPLRGVPCDRQSWVDFG
jgi:hypothetical protein